MIGNLNAHGAFTGHALDEDRFGFGGETKVFREAGDAAVFDASLRTEFEGSDDRTRIDLHHLAEDIELGAFFDENLRGGAQFVFPHR